MNITLSVSNEVVRQVRKIAVDRNTTLTAIVREYLESVGGARRSSAGASGPGARRLVRSAQPSDGVSPMDSTGTA